MAVVLSLITSALWGTSDFFGGLATRRDHVTRVMLWAHTLGLIATAAVSPFLADSLTLRDALLGGLAGIVGLAGLLLLYQGLSRGPMAVVAPLSALTAALVPVLWGLRSDDALSAATTAGLLIGLCAVVAISWERRPVEGAPLVTARTVIEAIIAGSCFGSIVLIYDIVDEDSAPWPIASGRLVTVAVLVLFLLSRGMPLAPRRGATSPRAVGFAAIAGLGDTTANVTLLLATGEAVGSTELSIVAVVTALFPAATVLWARVVLAEPLGRVRTAGLGFALAAVVLMTIG